MNQIEICGKKYPVRNTMGAMRRYKLLTGNDVEQMNTSNDMLIYVYCALQSTCATEKVSFDMTLDEFADSLEPDVFAKFISSFFGKKSSSTGTSKKK